MTDPRARCSDSDFVRLFEEVGPTKLAKQLGITIKSVLGRRRSLEVRIGRQITGPAHPKSTRHGVAHPGRLECEVKDGIVLIGSDGHYWPGKPTTAHRAFVKFCKDYRPSVVIMNGDALDGARISRHAPIGWEDRPQLIEELDACKERLHEIVMAKPPRSKCYWPLGNHDGRFETRIATVAPELAKVHGVHLKDHFGDAWLPCWSVWINDSVVVKHRWKGGVHAAHNNTLGAGKTIITGHTHQLKVSPLPDYNGVRWGVETGCLADPHGRQFLDYTEDNPRMWQSGFVMLTFKGGELLQPEIVRVHSETHVDFRGELIRI